MLNFSIQPVCELRFLVWKPATSPLGASSLRNRVLQTPNKIGADAFRRVAWTYAFANGLFEPALASAFARPIHVSTDTGFVTAPPANGQATLYTMELEFAAAWSVRCR